jgi:hypothetical protein
LSHTRSDAPESHERDASTTAKRQPTHYTTLTELPGQLEQIVMRWQLGVSERVGKLQDMDRVGGGWRRRTMTCSMNHARKHDKRKEKECRGDAAGLAGGIRRRSDRPWFDVSRSTAVTGLAGEKKGLGKRAIRSKRRRTKGRTRQNAGVG